MSQISEHSEFCNISPPLTAQSAAGGQGCERLAFPAEVCYNGCKKNVRRDVVLIAITNASLPSKKRILTVCVKLFLEQGYKKTTVAQIVQQASVSNSIFQNIFRAKDGVLAELVEFMFSNQFATARSMAGAHLPPAYVYAVETAIQMTLTELNENLREIYIEAYTQKEASDYIFLRDSQGTLSDLRFLSAGVDRTGLLLYGARLCRNHAGLYGASVRRGTDAGKEAANVPDHEPPVVSRP